MKTRDIIAELLVVLCLPMLAVCIYWPRGECDVSAWGLVVIGGIVGLGGLAICFAAGWKPLKVAGSLFLYAIILFLILPIGLMAFNLKVSTCVDLLLRW